MKKTIKAWAAFDLYDEVILWTISKDRSNAIFEVTGQSARRWTKMYSAGYRIRRIIIVVED